MKLFKFEFDNQIGNAVIDVDTNSEYFIGIPNEHAEYTTVKLFDGETELSTEESKDGYDLYQFNEGNDAFRRSLKAIRNYDKPSLSVDSFEVGGYEYKVSTNSIRSLPFIEGGTLSPIEISVYQNLEFIGTMTFRSSGRSTGGQRYTITYPYILSSTIDDVSDKMNGMRFSVAKTDLTLEHIYFEVRTPAAPVYTNTSYTTTKITDAESSLSKKDILVICHKSNIADVGNSSKDVVGIVENSGKFIEHNSNVINHKSYDLLSSNVYISGDTVLDGSATVSKLNISYGNSFMIPELSATKLSGQIDLYEAQIIPPFDVWDYSLSSWTRFTPIKLTTTVEGRENMDVYVLGYANLT